MPKDSVTKKCTRCGKFFLTNKDMSLCKICRQVVKLWITKGDMRADQFVDLLPDEGGWKERWATFKKHNRKALEGVGSIESAEPKPVEPKPEPAKPVKKTRKKDALPGLNMKAPQPIVRESWQDEEGEITICRSFEEGCKLIADFLQTCKVA